jgi:hypothetical protein
MARLLSRARIRAALGLYELCRGLGLALVCVSARVYVLAAREEEEEE